MRRLCSGKWHTQMKTEPAGGPNPRPVCIHFHTGIHPDCWYIPEVRSTPGPWISTKKQIQYRIPGSAFFVERKVPMRRINPLTRARLEEEVFRARAMEGDQVVMEKDLYLQMIHEIKVLRFKLNREVQKRRENR